jgi:inner membrane protein
MDPISHWALGVSAAASSSGSVDRSSTETDRLKESYLFGGLGAVAPDLDSLIQSAQDPLLYIQFHRHFTHSLLFIPFGSLLIAIVFIKPLSWLLGRKLSFKYAWCYASLGMATHGFLDACTSYGTHLLWPFSNSRTAWNIISIIDPLFTVPMLLFLGLALIRKKAALAKLSLVWSLLILTFGFIQHQRAISFYQEVLRPNGEIQRIDAKPSFGNLWLWRGISLQDDVYSVDALFLPPFMNGKILRGDQVAPLNTQELAKHFHSDSRALRDLERFRFFSDDYLYIVSHSNDSYLIGDLRYSLLPHSSEPLWVIELAFDHPDQPTPYNSVRAVTPEKRRTFYRFLIGDF